MLSRRLIACLDVQDGRIVKGVRFAALTDAGDPAARGELYERQGADEIVILDVSATPQGRCASLETIRRVRAVLSIPITVGGGIGGVQDAQAVLAAGADKVAVNSAAVQRPGILTDLSGRFGRQCVVLAIDAARRGDGRGGWEVLTRSGTNRTGLDAVAWTGGARALGAGEVLLTSWDRDGTRQGYDLELIRSVAEATQLPVIASGGASGPAHMVEAFAAGADAVLAASIFHHDTMSIQLIKRELARAGLEVRR